MAQTRARPAGAQQTKDEGGCKLGASWFHDGACDSGLTNIMSSVSFFRMLSNRESARRSRKRKQEHLTKLEQEVRPQQAYRHLGVNCP